MEKKPWLRLNISNCCNFNCRHCHVFKISKNILPPILMNYEIMDFMLGEYLRILKSAGEKKLQLSIYGGEPLLNRKNLFKLITKYAEQFLGIELSWIVNTNGSLLTKDDVTFFKKYNVDIHISCDGLEQTHNKNRRDKLGRGTFQRIQTAMALIKKYHIRAQINSFISPENINHLKEIVDLANNFEIRRIYLDLFYSPRMMGGRKLADKYLDVCEYGRQKSVQVFGPGDEIRDNFFKRRYFQYAAVPSLDINVDGSWYFSRLPINREAQLYNQSEFKKDFILSEYNKILLESKKYVARACCSCFLEDFCSGKAIGQFQYHTKKITGYGAVCSFMKDICLGDRFIKLDTVQIAITYDCNKACSYCYARDLRGSYKEMKVDDFKKVLFWLEKNGIKHINLTGGEPTIHSNFTEFINLASQKGFKVGIFSNGLFSTKSLSVLKKCSHFLINYNSQTHYSVFEKKQLDKNLAKLSSLEKKISLMINITERTESSDYVVRACRQFNIKDVILDLIIPNAFKSNEYIKIQLIRQKKKLLLEFLEKLKKENIKVKISRPMPRCIFTNKELSWLRQFDMVRFQCGIGRSVITINPDLSIFPCLSIFLKGPKILELPDAESYRNYYQAAIDILKWERPLFKKCQKCLYFKNRECQGSCLGYKCRQFYLIKKPRYIIYSQQRPDQVSRLIWALDDALFILDKIFGRIDQRLKIYLFKEKQDLAIYSGAFNYPDWVRSFTHPADYEYYQFSDSRANLVLEGLLHEITHFYIHRFSRGQPPTWLAEGFCEYINFYNKENRQRLRALAKNKKLFLFNSLNSGRLIDKDVSVVRDNIAYQQAHGFVRFLIKIFGPDILLRLLLDSYDNFYSHFFNLTGTDFFKVEKAWREKIINKSC